MRILHLIHRYLPARGGAENYLAGINRGLVERGHTVTVATTDLLDFERLWDSGKEKLLLAEETIDKVQIIRFPVRHLPFSQLSFPIARRATYYLSQSRLSQRLASRLTRLTPPLPEFSRWIEQTADHFDLIAGMTITLEGVVTLGTRLAQRLNVPFVVYPLTHLGAGPTPGSDTLSRYYTMPHQRQLVLQSSGVVGITRTECDYYAAYGKIDSEMCVAPPGLDQAAEPLGDGERFRNQHQIQGPIVVVVSTMDKEKGTIDTIEACRLLWERGDSLSLVLAGTITSRFKQYLEQLRPEQYKDLYILGPVPEADKWDLLDAADIFCMPSRTESFGIAYLEAWAKRLPVIGANTWGIRNDVILQNQDGLLVDFGDQTMLAASIKQLLEDPALRKRLGNAGNLKLESVYNWPRSIQTIENFYQMLVSGHSKH